MELSPKLLVEVLKKLSNTMREAGGFEIEVDSDGAYEIGRKFMAMESGGWVEDEKQWCFFFFF